MPPPPSKVQKLKKSPGKIGLIAKRGNQVVELFQLIGACEISHVSQTFQTNAHTQNKSNLTTVFSIANSVHEKIIDNYHGNQFN